MRDWIILLEAAGGPTAEPLALETVEAMLARLEDRYPSALHAADRCAVQFVVCAEEPHDALGAGIAAWRQATADLAIAEWDLVRTEVKTQAELAAEYATTTDERTVTATDPEALAAAYAATRNLLRITRREQASSVLVTLVLRLGGTLGPPDLDDPRVLPIDVSLGAAEPLMPLADELSIARLCLEEILPPVVEDAREAVARLGDRAASRLAGRV